MHPKSSKNAENTKPKAKAPPQRPLKRTDETHFKAFRKQAFAIAYLSVALHGDVTLRTVITMLVNPRAAARAILVASAYQSLPFDRPPSPPDEELRPPTPKIAGTPPSTQRPVITAEKPYRVISCKISMKISTKRGASP